MPAEQHWEPINPSLPVALHPQLRLRLPVRLTFVREAVDMFTASLPFQMQPVTCGRFRSEHSFLAGCTAPSAPTSIAGPVNVCQGGCGYVYSIAPIPNATSYMWTVPVGASITSGQGTTSISVCFSAVAQYGV